MYNVHTYICLSGDFDLSALLNKETLHNSKPRHNLYVYNMYIYLCNRYLYLYEIYVYLTYPLPFSEYE